MKDDLDQRLRSYFSIIEQDSPAEQPMPIHQSGMAIVRPHPAFRYALAAAAIVCLVAGAIVVRSRVEPTPSTPGGATLVTTASGPTDPSDPTASTSPAGAATFPAADPAAKNLLVVGTDTNDCVSPGSPTAGGFGDRTALEPRSDTIMIVRVEPASNHVSILSFPRDLWVKIDGTDGSNRINSALQVNDPQRLINTIYTNFGIPIDHYIQIDFCAFKTIVDAIGGVTVPFQYPARDTHTGLDVPVAGCRTLDGDEALAYVRSRHYTYLAPNGQWTPDPTSDLGRISRQQDFIWRTLTSALDHGLSDPIAAERLIGTLLANVVTDPNLTPALMLQLAGLAHDLDPASIANTQIPASPQVIAGNSVLIPDLANPQATSILEAFRGEPAPTPPQASSSDPSTTGTDDITTPPAVSIGPATLTFGIIPPATTSC